MKECEVLIVGSGPAGSSAAYHLSRLGIGDVVVLERLSEVPYRRYHSICGEAVSDRMFRDASIEPPEPIRRVDGISISFPGGSDIRIPVSGSVIDRNDLLRRLRDDCDARFVRGTAVSVRKDDDGYVVVTTDGEYRCRVLIGADGSHSVVRRDVFGTSPEEMIPIVNNIVEGESDSTLAFTVSERYGGAYRWRFPSHDGTVSTGYIVGTDEEPRALSRGARHMPVGRLPSVQEDGCYLVGDAASLANPLCFGGIGVALLSGRSAAEAIVSGEPSRYSSWIRRSILFDPHFMDAHRQFSTWTDAEIADAMSPFRNGYSTLRGLVAMMRRPSYANIYMSCWLGFKYGW